MVPGSAEEEFHHTISVIVKEEVKERIIIILISDYRHDSEFR
jgi:hypothetical protein